MPKFDDIISQNQAQLEKAKLKARRQQSFEIPRNSERRPWSDQLPGAESLRQKQIEFEDLGGKTLSNEALPSHLSPGPESASLMPSSSPSPWLQWVQENRRHLVAICGLTILFWVPLGWYALSLPSQFQTTLQVYAPERSDTISSRLTLFSNRVEFASFPTENKVPISLLSRRLRQSEARQWVIQKYLESAPAETLSFDPGSLQVETTYIPASEILVIETYSNSAVASAALNTLYWRYFQSLLNELDRTQGEKVQNWVALTLEKIDSEIDRSIQTLQKSSPKGTTATVVHHLQNTLKENIASNEIRRTQLVREIEELKKLAATDNLDLVTGVTDQELQNLVEIRRGLLAQQDASQYFARIDELAAQFKVLAGQKLNDRSVELQNLDSKKGLYQVQAGAASQDESRLRVASEALTGLESQLSSLRSQKTELLKFKTQIDLEPHLHSSNIKLLQAPRSDAAIERPTLSLRLVASGLAALAMSALAVLGFGLIFRAKRK